MKSLWLLFLVGLAPGFISRNLLVSSQSPSATTDDLYLESHTSGVLPIDDEDGEYYDSGSGSGDYDFMQPWEIFNSSNGQEMFPTEPQPTADSPQNPPTTEKDAETTPFVFPEDKGDEEVVESTVMLFLPGAGPSTTSMPPSATDISIDISVSKDVDKDNSLDRWDNPTAKDSGDEDLIQDDMNEIYAKNGQGGRMVEVESPDDVTSENIWQRIDVLAAVIACVVVGFLCAIFLLVFLAYRMKKKDEGSYDLGDTKLTTTAYQKAPTKEFYA